MHIVTSHPIWAHDSNYSFFDGERLHYLKLERFFEQKHFSSPQLVRTPELLIQNDTLVKLLIEKKHNIYIKEIFYNSSIGHHLMHSLSVDLFLKEKQDVHVVIDGIGDYKVWSIIRDNKVIMSKDVYDAQGSIGAITTFLGAELGLKGLGLDLPGKVMGIQSYGCFDSEIYESVKKYNMNFLGDKYLIRSTISKSATVLKKFREGYSAYKVSKLQESKKINAVHTIHKRLGEIVLEIFEKYVNPDEKIAYSGGVAQNVVWNTELKKRYPKLTILPHCGDEGLSLGTMELFRKKYDLKFDLSHYPFMQSDEAPDDEPTIETIQKTAKHLANGKIVAWYQGHGEIGPRALGHRSILMDPRIKNGKDTINRVKNRESFRPFGASVLSEYAKEYFDLDFENPYMLYLGTTQKDNLDAITHVDGTCRAQTVDKNFDTNFRLLLEYFYDITECPVLLNTSLNEAGKPIAGWIRNAEAIYSSSPIDVLVIGNKIYEK